MIGELYTLVLRSSCYNFYYMDTTPRAISWEAPEHHHVEKGNDWFFALAIVVVACVIAAILLNNVLFALLLGIAGGMLAVSAARRPSIIPFEVSIRGVRVEDRLYKYGSFISYHIDEEDPRGPQLLLRSEHRLMPLIILPLPVDHVDDIEEILKERLPEEELHEPILIKIMELFGF